MLRDETGRSGAVATDDSAWFFEGLVDDVLLLLRCDDCGRWSRPSAKVCTSCRSRGLSATASNGRGRAISVISDPPDPDGRIHYVGLVELAEGPWIAAEIVATEAPHVGDHLVFEAMTFDQGQPVPCFRPEGQGSDAPGSAGTA